MGPNGIDIQPELGCRVGMLMLLGKEPEPVQEVLIRVSDPYLQRLNKLFPVLLPGSLLLLQTS